jgi:hypothetical protein
MKTLLKSLYESEINILIDWMGDSGIQVKIGDRINGFKEVEIFEFEKFDDIEKWIEYKVKFHFPDSKFAKTYNGDDFDSAVEPAIRYLFRNHNPHTKIYIDYAVAELLQGQRTHHLTDEIPD